MIFVQNLQNDNYNAAANQFVIRTKTRTYFQSYQSKVAYVDKNGKVHLAQWWDYSNTTRKHLYIFLRDYTPYRVRAKKEVQDYIKRGIFKQHKVSAFAA